MRLALCVLLTACTSSNSVVCGDQALCPEHTICDPVMLTDGTTVDFCVAQTQLDACTGRADGAACDTPANGTCHGGACLPTGCGNALVDHDEVCDDGNQLSNDGCSGECLSTETCGNTTTDVIKGESCDLGPDHLGHDGCSSGCALEQATFTPMLPGRPRARGLAPLAYDVDRGRVVLFGGLTIANIFTGIGLSETYEWDGLRWSRPDLAGTPSPRGGNGLVYDAARKQVVLFGGTTFTNDTWTWDGVAWTLHEPANRPQARFTQMTYDAKLGKVVLFGGGVLEGGGVTVVDDTWTWDGTDWHLETPATKPPPLVLAGMAYDPKRGVIVMYGGTGTMPQTTDVWEYDGATWTKKTAAGAPSKRVGAATAWDPVTGKILVAGGSTDGATFNLTDAFEWDGTTWTTLPAMPGPSANGAATDSRRGRVVVYTGVNVFEWNGATWSTPPLGGSPAPPEPAPVARQAHAAVRDARLREIVMFGGTTDNGVTAALGDTWTFDGVWRQQSSAATPSARWGMQMAYDVKRDTTVLFGGCTHATSPTTCDALLADTWLWKNHAWTHVFPTTVPPTRAYYTMDYDPIRERVVMFGGREAAVGTQGADTYTWDGTNWHLETPSMSPPKREQATMGFDPISKRMILFGGHDAALDIAFKDTWAWDGTTWSDVSSQDAPPPTVQARMAVDGSRGRLEMVGGLIAFGGGFKTTTIDTWEWDGSHWHDIPTDTTGVDNGRYGHVLATAPDGDGVIMSGGSSVTGNTLFTGALGDTWRRDWRGATAYETCIDVDTDGDGLVGCADPDCWWSCSPACPPNTSCSSMPGTCGDGACDAATEQCTSCPADCGACAARCGNFTCDTGETAQSCPGDCH